MVYPQDIGNHRERDLGRSLAAKVETYRHMDTRNLLLVQATHPSQAFSTTGGRLPRAHGSDIERWRAYRLHQGQVIDTRVMSEGDHRGGFMAIPGGNEF